MSQRYCFQLVRIFDHSVCKLLRKHSVHNRSFSSYTASAEFIELWFSSSTSCAFQIYQCSNTIYLLSRQRQVYNVLQTNNSSRMFILIFRFSRLTNAPYSLTTIHHLCHICIKKLLENNTSRYMFGLVIFFLKPG